MSSTEVSLDFYWRNFINDEKLDIIEKYSVYYARQIIDLFSINFGFQWVWNQFVYNKITIIVLLTELEEK